MDNDIPDIRPFEQRRYEQVPIDKIKVINSRNRDEEQFKKNVRSIEHNGQLKPIVVNDKFLERTQMYELVCGEGRLLARQQLGHTHVWADVVTCTRKAAHLKSLVENLARTNPRTMDYARELKRLHDEGWNYKKLAGITSESATYVRNYIRLIKQGEERLIHGVEQGVFPMRFAIDVAASDDALIQNVLMDAFDEGLVTTTNFAQARRIISARSKDKKRGGRTEYTVGQLKQDIVDATKAKTSYVQQAETKENRFMTLLNEINELWRDEEFLKLLREEGVSDRPKLSGDFSYEF